MDFLHLEKHTFLACYLIAAEVNELETGAVPQVSDSRQAKNANKIPLEWSQTKQKIIH
jgi:hypothetical protein